MVRNGLIVAPDTGLLERSFRKLSKNCHNDRNRFTSKHPQTFYSLCQFKGNEVDYEKAIKILEK